MRSIDGLEAVVTVLAVIVSCAAITWMLWFLAQAVRYQIILERR